MERTPADTLAKLAEVGVIIDPTDTVEDVVRKLNEVRISPSFGGGPAHVLLQDASVFKATKRGDSLWEKEVYNETRGIIEKFLRSIQEENKYTEYLKTE
jgi:hypothetical protein